MKHCLENNEKDITFLTSNYWFDLVFNRPLFNTCFCHRVVLLTLCSVAASIYPPGHWETAGCSAGSTTCSALIGHLRSWRYTGPDHSSQFLAQTKNVVLQELAFDLCLHEICLSDKRAFHQTMLSCETCVFIPYISFKMKPFSLKNYK